MISARCCLQPLVFAACEHANHLRSLVVEFLRHISAVADVVSDVAHMFLVCCVVVVVACVADELLLRMLRACAALPVRLTYVVTQEYARQLDVGDASSVEAALHGPSSDGRAVTCGDALYSLPLTELQFSETKV